MILSSPWHFILAGATTFLAGWYSLRTLLSLSGRPGIQESFAAQILLIRAAALKAAGFLKVKHG
jgi:hypothetical protein